MSIANIRPKHFDVVHLLLDHDLADPISVLVETFFDHRLWELKDYLWNAQEACMVSDVAPFEEIGGRGMCIFYTFSIMKCLEAAKLIADQRKAADSQPDLDDPAVKYKNIGSLSLFDLSAASEYYGNKLAYFTSKANEMNATLGTIARQILKLTAETERNIPT